MARRLDGFESSSGRTVATVAWDSPRSRSLGVSERKLALYVIDSSGLAISLAIALSVLPRELGPSDFSTGLWWVALLVGIWTVVAAVDDEYELRRLTRLRESLPATCKGALVTSLIYFAIPYVTPPLLASRVSLFVFVGALLVWLLSSRLIYARLVRQPRFQRRAIAIGPVEVTSALAALLKTNASLEYELVGVIHDDGQPSHTATASITARLRELVSGGGIDEVVIAYEGGVPAELTPLLIALYEEGVEVTQFSALYEQLSGRIPVRHIHHHWHAVMPPRAGGGRPYEVLKRVIDTAVAAVVLILLAPMLLCVALIIRLERGGPILYRQVRIGHLGRPFALYKFRTMGVDAEVGGPVWAADRDPRRTRNGRWLRPTRLDELPQLFNVLKGDMSLIGPRPERPEFVEHLRREIPFYSARSLTKPGLTGWAQVRLPYARTTEEQLEKLQYDLYYVKHRSLFLDFVVALKTLNVLVRMSGS